MIANNKIKLGVVVILASLGFIPVSAKTHEYDAVKCRLVTPDSWTAFVQNRTPGDAIFFSALGSDSAKNAHFYLYVRHSASTAPLNADSECVKRVVASCKENRSEILGQDTQTVNGINYYVLLVRQDVVGSRYNSAECWLTVKDGNVYELWIGKKNDDASQDRDLSSIVDSFSFTDK